MPKKFNVGDSVEIVGQSEEAARDWIGIRATVVGYELDYVLIRLEENPKVGRGGGTYQWSERYLAPANPRNDILYLLEKIYKAQDNGDISQDDARTAISVLIQVL